MELNKGLSKIGEGISMATKGHILILEGMKEAQQEKESIESRLKHVEDKLVELTEFIKAHR